MVVQGSSCIRATDSGEHAVQVSMARDIIATRVSAGIRPCVPRALVTMSVHWPMIGMVATFAIAAGIAATVPLVGLSALIFTLYGRVQVALSKSGYITPFLTKR